MADVLDALQVFNTPKGPDAEPWDEHQFIAVSALPEFIHNVGRAWYAAQAAAPAAAQPAQPAQAEVFLEAARNLASTISWPVNTGARCTIEPDSRLEPGSVAIWQGGREVVRVVNTPSQAKGGQDGAQG